MNESFFFNVRPKKKPIEDVDNIINVMQNYKWFLK
jgi:hypothetical protein